MHSWNLRFKMLGDLSSGLPGNTIGPSEVVEGLGGFFLDEDETGDIGEASLFSKMFFISLSFAKLMGDFFVALRRSCREFLATSNRTVSLWRPRTATCNGELPALSVALTADSIFSSGIPSRRMRAMSGSAAR